MDILRIGHVVVLLPSLPIIIRPCVHGFCGEVSWSRWTIFCTRYDKFVRITDGTARDIDFNVTSTFIKESFISIAIVHLVVFTNQAVTIGTFIIQSIAHRTQSTTAIDRTENFTSADGHVNAAGHVTSRVGITIVATTATEDVTIHVTGSPGTNLGSTTDSKVDITHDVTIFTATED